jgi:hypothetical protein
MTRADLFEAGTDQYLELKAKIQNTNDAEERNRLQLQVLCLLDGMLYVIEKMKHLT